MKRIYAVMGASGHIGSELAKHLLASGHEVRALGRSPERMKILEEKGAKLCTTSFDDKKALGQAFLGCDGVFTMIPPDMTQADYSEFQFKVGEAISGALSETKVRHAVNLSSVGGHLSAGTGVVVGLHLQEVRLNALSGIHILHLRPVSFMENLLWTIDLLKSQGFLGEAYHADLKIPMIATRDIAQRAASLLLELSFEGKTAQELLGQRDLTMTEIAGIVGQAIGKPGLPYVQYSYEDQAAGMKGMGMPEKTIALMIELYRGINEGVLNPVEPRSAKSSTPTSIEEFVKSVFLPAFQKKPGA